MTVKRQLHRKKPGRPKGQDLKKIFLGRHQHTEEVKKKISESCKGRIAWNTGLPAWNRDLEWPLEVRVKISLGMLRYWANKTSKHEP